LGFNKASYILGNWAFLRIPKEWSQESKNEKSIKISKGKEKERRE
jgi:hypothetical protein